ncbi:MAG: hypothetical protein HY550_06575 [Elusimicrobia bacterium]|nr:hypothetical protein [Elusimicrobiota bacterium]
MRVHGTHIKLLVACACVSRGVLFGQVFHNSTGTATVVDSEVLENESGGMQPQVLSPVSRRMLEKMRELEKTAAVIEGQDNAALEKIGGKIDRTIALLPLNGDLIAAIKDKRFDWRVRCLLMFYKSYTAGESKITKYSGDFIGIMRDKTEHEKVRGMAALMLVDISAKNPKVNEALKEVAKAPDTPGEVLKAVMVSVGYAGIDDADVLMKLTERQPADFNEIGINLNAIRALGKSKDPRAIGYLIKIFDDSAPDSFYNYTAIEQFWDYIGNPETRERVKPLIIPRFLKLLDDRSRLGPSRREAAGILAELKVKEAVDPILRWFLPADGFSAKMGGGNDMDVLAGTRYLLKLGDKRAIPVLEHLIENFANDSRWSWAKAQMAERGQKLPEDHQDYKHLKECLKKLKKQK